MAEAMQILANQAMLDRVQHHQPIHFNWKTAVNCDMLLENNKFTIGTERQPKDSIAAAIFHY